MDVAYNAIITGTGGHNHIYHNDALKWLVGHTKGLLIPKGEEGM